MGGMLEVSPNVLSIIIIIIAKSEKGVQVGGMLEVHITIVCPL